MSDLISREDAITAVTIAVLADKDEIEALKAIPSVQVNGDLISRQDAIEAVGEWMQKEFGYLDLNRAERLIDKIEALPSADAVSMEEHIKELNDLAVEWNAKFAKAEKITGEIYEETMAKVAKECEECKERLRNIRPSADAEPSLKAIKRQIDEHWYLDTPSAEAVHGWRTGKPKENGEYMVTLDAWGHRYINIMHYAKPQMPNRNVDGMCWYRSDDEWGDVVYDDNDILAWMPLPTPYKGGGSE